MAPVQPPNMIRLTTAQAIVRFLAHQFIEIDGVKQTVCGGGFGIFGHGNVTCLGEALYEARDILPLYRGQNEQSMGFAAAAYAKFHLRQRFMFCTASAGPGTSNMVTSCAVAHTNRLPVLFLCGDTYTTRLPDPVLQQIETFDDPTQGVNDTFRPVSRYWDRITHPAQVLQSLPTALATLLDPADCGPAFIGLPQDVQGWAFDYPESFFTPTIHRIRRPVPDPRDIEDAAALLATAQRPIIIAGGGVQYAQAAPSLDTFTNQFQIPVVETIAGRANLVDTHPLNIGPVGVTGSESANTIAKKADVILVIGSRLQDFTTGSWTAFDLSARFIAVNTSRFDATKHRSLSVVGDARVSLEALTTSLGNYKAPETWVTFAQAERAKWQSYVADNVKVGAGCVDSYAQAIGIVNAACDPKDRILTAAGGLPSELAANWRTLHPGTVDIEYGYSCMGYEIAGGWGARIAQEQVTDTQDVIVFVGDGSYLMLNSDIYSSVLSRKKLIIIVLDNGGFAVINKLQNNTGNESYNNLLRDTPTIPEVIPMDFAAHAKAMGAYAESISSLTDLGAAFRRAKQANRTAVIVAQVDPYDGWTTGGHTWWEVGTPSVSESASVRAAHTEIEAARSQQRKG